jgi:hypothetical protein
MTRLVLALFAIVAIATPSTAAPAQRTARRAAPRAVPTVAFDGDAARHLPSDAILYLEVSNVASVAEQLGGADYLYSLLKTTFPAEFPASGKPLFTSEQFRGLLGSRIALAALPRPGRAGASLSSSEPHVAVLVQTPSAEVAALVESMVVDANRRVTKTAARPRTQTVRGVKVTTTTTTAGKPMSHAVAGATLLFGDAAALTRIIGENGRPSLRPLAAEPGFVTAVQRAHASRQFFAYLNGKPFVKAFHEGLEGGSKSMTPAGSKGAEIAAFKRFIGLDALLAGSLSASLEGDTLDVRGAIELDRGIGGLVTVLSDPPAITLRSNELFPAGTDVATAFSIDLVRIYDLVVATLTPEVTKSMGFSLPEAIEAAEGAIGMKLRDDLLASIGNELAFGMRLVEKPAIVAVQDAAPAAPTPDVEWITAMEVRNPEVLARAVANITKLFNSPPQPAGEGGEGSVMEDAGTVQGVPMESHEGFPIYGTGSFRQSLLGDFFVFGTREGIVGAIDAKTKQAALATDASYAAAVGTVPDGTIWATYASPRFFAWAAKSASTAAGGRAPEIAFPNGLFLSVQKDASGIESGFRIPIPNLKMLLEKERAKTISRR